MNRDEVFAAIDRQRLRVCELLSDLAVEEWERPSLCDGWTVRDVAAHLTLQQLGLRDLGKATVAMVRARGNLDRGIWAMAKSASSKSTDRMIAEIRGMVGSQKINMGVTYKETLIDILVHSQDIAVPLGRTLEVEPAPAAVAADRIWEMKGPFFVKKKFSGYRLTATDTDWSVGEGVEVSGPVDALLLVLVGRLVALPRLSGAGVGALTARLTF
ncbi:hypothetical protein [Alloactinosynnema sp. L-07]|uniref:maleylpyruvate isomerase family mycothiol-dependent enzyme n=1 Tax=Alloactinosynnema sp. L-07 TaxID=1653480 RepID=UPI00065F0560|nr:maleylpyruvate isomerase family mycothiol-dependent enzyme [Alloactinosynnema sp. L-07]CRK58004.1 hypothetical protein [Alloactinosynnema sp. L-07]